MIIPKRKRTMQVGQLVDVTVTNLRDRDQCWTAPFKIDPTAHDNVAPASYLRSIGLEPAGSRQFAWKDRVLYLQFAIAYVMCDGDPAGAMIYFGPEDCEPTLGFVALQAARIYTTAP